MERFSIMMMLGNDSMRTPADVARALRKLADRLDGEADFGRGTGRIFDDNGNTVGEWEHDPTSENE